MIDDKKEIYMWGEIVKQRKLIVVLEKTIQEKDKEIAMLQNGAQFRRCEGLHKLLDEKDIEICDLKSEIKMYKDYTPDIRKVEELEKEIERLKGELEKLKKTRYIFNTIIETCGDKQCQKK